MTDDQLHQAAAALASAFAARTSMTPDDAAETYFACLGALDDMRKEREKDIS